ncbi:MAG: glyoxalase [Gammaproteobacteria bacterium]|nr:glyoxalase [Gammaproteobacteria bacterium]NIN38670.1 glyoxalase [Gammaproteobacteria bacterium]NIO24806.1 glyoxalase [Gammaproteobacteria bacterium]NIO65409.1 glyoxalase [Gammaproteobacteria bacterium]NIP47639.1 glyoxalase [Gammaproteobacteria bacterium]
MVATMRVNRIDHFNIRTRDLDALCEFYTKVLGLEIGDRPPFDTPGVWLYAGGHPILHVGLARDGDEEAHGDGTLPLDHIALETEGLLDAVARIEKAGIAYRMVDVPGRAMKQIFIHDPDGVALELNFTNPEDIAAGAGL